MNPLVPEFLLGNGAVRQSAGRICSRVRNGRRSASSVPAVARPLRYKGGRHAPVGQHHGRRPGDRRRPRGRPGHGGRGSQDDQRLRASGGFASRELVFHVKPGFWNVGSRPRARMVSAGDRLTWSPADGSVRAAVPFVRSASVSTGPRWERPSPDPSRRGRVADRA